jgi:hypothetical protein
MNAKHSGRYIAYYRVSTARQGRSGRGLEAQAPPLFPTFPASLVRTVFVAGPNLPVRKVDSIPSDVGL